MHLDVECLPSNVRGTVAIGDVTAVSIDTEGRAGNPYPPGKVRVNGSYWPTDIGAADAVLTWAHRNRFTLRASGGIIQQDAGDQGGAEGGYRVEILLDGVVEAARTVEGIIGTTFTYTLAQNSADDPGGAKAISFRITPVNRSLEGRPRTTDPFSMG
jgi:hypothetical protein